MRKSSPNKALLISGLIIAFSTPLFVIFIAPLIGPSFCSPDTAMKSVCESSATWIYAVPITVVVTLLIGIVLIALSLFKKK